jgi:hypothetical protein
VHQLQNVVPGHRLAAAVRRILVTVFALMVLLPSIAFARSQYRCRFDGQVRSSCCCPATAQPHEAPGPAAMRAACCCTVLEVAPSRAQPATEDNRDGSRSHLPAFVAWVSAYAAAPMTIVSVAPPRPRSMAPPDRGQALFVRHCSFLL